MTSAIASPATSQDIKLWGNSLGVRIPAAIARHTGLHADQRVTLTVANGCVVITPQAPALMTLAQRLAQFDPAVHGGESMAAAPVGKERW